MRKTRYKNHKSCQNYRPQTRDQNKTWKMQSYKSLVVAVNDKSKNRCCCLLYTNLSFAPFPFPSLQDLTSSLLSLFTNFYFVPHEFIDNFLHCCFLYLFTNLYFVAPVPIYKFLLRPSWTYIQIFTSLAFLYLYIQICTSFLPVAMYIFFTSSLLYLYTNVYIIPPCSAAKYKFLLHCSYTYIQICTSFLHVAMYNFLLRSHYI